MLYLIDHHGWFHRAVGAYSVPNLGYHHQLTSAFVAWIPPAISKHKRYHYYYYYY